MNFEHSDRVKTLQAKLTGFMEQHIYPRIQQHRDDERAGIYPVSFMEDLKALARSEGLWNLFLPGLKDDEPGTRLTNLEYAPLAEIMGRVPWCSEVFNCNAPDTGNMELLHMFATPAQREQWLVPLLNGEIRSAFAMTEPDVGSSDATNIQTRITRDGNEYVITGRKWYISNSAHPDCKLFILMGKTDPDNPNPHQQQSMILIPKDAPGVKILRNLKVMSRHSSHGHCEIKFDNVRVPASNLLGEEGSGFAMAQARLGPGRIHHCMRSIGQAELALQLMISRAQERKTNGKYIYQHGAIAEWIARSRIEIDQARLLVLRAAWKIDEVGAKGAADEISLIKAQIPTLHTTVVDRAMQTFGAMGTSEDLPLADMWTQGRALRYADGPDEVHIRKIARMEIKRTNEKAIDLSHFYFRPDYDE